MKQILIGKCSRREKGFTLVELLVVIAVLALLAALTLPALAGNREQTRIAQCTGNLRQFALAVQVYGSENNERLPGTTGTGSWAWDISRTLIDSLLASGATREQMYDPGVPEQNADFLWNFGGAGNTFRVLGYAVTFPGSLIITANINSNLIPPYVQIASQRIPAPAASTRVLLACATLSAPKANPTVAQVFFDPSQFNFINVFGSRSHRASHLSGTIPAGGNVAMLDGHVEWREFKNMTNRVSNGTPNFWW